MIKESVAGIVEGKVYLETHEGRRRGFYACEVGTRLLGESILELPPTGGFCRDASVMSNGTGKLIAARHPSTYALICQRRDQSFVGSRRMSHDQVVGCSSQRAVRYLSARTQPTQYVIALVVPVDFGISFANDRIMINLN